MATATTDPVRLPPGPRVPKVVQSVAFLTARQRVVAALSRRYGGAFTLNFPIFGRTVVVGDPILVKDLFSTGIDLLGRATRTFGEIAGPGSMWGLDGNELLQRRRLLMPPLHGKRMKSYEHIIEEEVMREITTWPEDREFETLPSMLRITLRAILRAVFGAEGPKLEELCDLVPPMVTIGSRIAFLPSVVRHDLGPWSPGGRFLLYRRRVDAVLNSLIAAVRADSAFEDRGDVLALLLQARDENGAPIPDGHVVDELLTLLVAGHETTATQLAWIVERLRRHPRLLSQLTDECDTGGSELRQATIWEVQRTRPVLDATFRRTRKRVRLGDWVIPQNTTVLVDMQLATAQSFPEAASFDPNRFLGANSKPVMLFPFGGGVNRCIGAAFANMEMNVTLRTLLREFRLVPTNAPGERGRDRGVTIAPARGGRAVVYRRNADASSDAHRAAVTGQRQYTTSAKRGSGAHQLRLLRRARLRPL
jgi:cytochrome P450